MASSLLALLDDIATILDDVALLTKVAAKKTAGVLGDDLALNAQQVTGVNADRELPVVWAVAKGSLVNKAILVPAALAISAVRALGRDAAADGRRRLPVLRGLREARAQVPAQPSLRRSRTSRNWHMRCSIRRSTCGSLEKDKIKGAVRTDFILSAEIIVITLGTVAGSAFAVQLAVLGAIALVMTIGVYGLVAAIVKLDDLGLYLSRQAARGRAVGRRRHPARRALADEGPLGRRHGGDVPGRRRHTGARRRTGARGARALH